MLALYATGEWEKLMRRSSLWFVAIIANLSFMLIFILQGVGDGFVVIRNVSTLPAATTEYVLWQLVLMLILQSFATGALQLYLHALGRKVRWEHFLLLVVLIYGSMVWPLIVFGDPYREMYPDEGHWRISSFLALCSVALLPFVFLFMIVREVYFGRKVRGG